MAIAYESESTSSNTNTCNVPSGTADGDLLVAIVTANNPTAGMTGPSGWTEVDEGSITGSQLMWSGYIFVSGTPPASYTWTTNSGAQRLIIIQRFSGVDSYGGASYQDNGSGTSNTAPTVTPDENDCLLVWCGAGYHSGGIATPTGYSNAANVAAGSVPDYLIASKVQGTAAATGSVVSTSWLNAGSITQRAGQMWFRPPGGGGGSTILPLMNHYLSG